MRYICCIAFIALLSGSLGQNQASSRSTEKKSMFAADRCLAKGGLGIINPSLYIIVKSDRNQLLNAGETWTGRDASSREVVMYFDQRVFSPQSLPKDFDLSKAIVISFEGSKIRFFDLGEMSGCYYSRQEQHTP